MRAGCVCRHIGRIDYDRKVMTYIGPNIHRECQSQIEANKAEEDPTYNYNTFIVFDPCMNEIQTKQMFYQMTGYTVYTINNTHV